MDEEPVLCKCGKPAHPLYGSVCEDCWAIRQGPGFCYGGTHQSNFGFTQRAEELISGNGTKHWKRKQDWRH